ncbi:Type IV secretion system protein virB10 [Alteripontixanthobacter maritimus]|uniref:Type IV secretion system protein virB10 n=1 Tax=Alteripontixanthobacter maritimus TaxID=2161824 RepID=A0A369QDU3_9SPHN|nr:TrbI/VirB10 family protein [Alteripontixanthobacter maritimus]RDC58907.1 Type IV secretion system protein virB10 [Alteripontixanthobacter maritimus]RDC61417.1 Type IV secretion system protein virB10 [Alteripontixanthobacter maritimus]
MTEALHTAQTDDDVRPVIATGNANNIGLWIFLSTLLLGGAFLFSALDARRGDVTAPSTMATTSDTNSRISSPPPLALPYDQRDYLDSRGNLPRVIGRIPIAVRPEPPERLPIPSPVQQTSVSPQQAQADPPVFQDSYRPLPLDTAERGQPVAGPPPVSDEEGDQNRVRARRLANPSVTVPQGTVIPAVLETAIDSTRPGGVRALVQRDIHAFDGSRVLIQRGSRLYGEYEAGIDAGQNRALIRWTRLIRPDGVTIALDSPASDPLGRAGVKGKVDSKFFQRFGGALLQSVLDIGVGVATREATDGVIVALPGSTQNVTPRVTTQEIQRTLKIRHGTSVSVFVARDLDFSTVEL